MIGMNALGYHLLLSVFLIYLQQQVIEIVCSLKQGLHIYLSLVLFFKSVVAFPKKDVVFHPNGGLMQPFLLNSTSVCRAFSTIKAHLQSPLWLECIFTSMTGFRSPEGERVFCESGCGII